MLVETSKWTTRLEVNGETIVVHHAPLARLIDVLREQLGLTGTKEGCSEGECGACAVLVDGKLVNSCLTPVGQLANCQVRTIEGVSQHGTLHPLQQAFLECGGAQCGICTPGMIMASIQLLERNPAPNRAEIREALAGNLCRCTGYMKIIEAVAKAASMQKASQSISMTPSNAQGESHASS